MRGVKIAILLLLVSSALLPALAVAGNGAAQDTAQDLQAAENLAIQGRLALYTAFLVAVGLAQAGVFVWQAIMYKKTLAQMQHAEERQLRAYVCVDGGKVILEDPNEISVEVVTKNAGQTPAYAVREWMQIQIAHHPLALPASDPPDDMRTGMAILPPGGEHTGGRTYPCNIQDAGVELGSASRTVFINGRICYKDAFGTNRVTKYRLMFGGPEGDKAIKDKETGKLIGRLRMDFEGNEAD